MITKIKDKNIGQNPIKAWQSRTEFFSKKREQELIQELVLCIRYCYVEQEKYEKEDLLPLTRGCHFAMRPVGRRGGGPGGVCTGDR
jgi:hypothetical protein